jgi:hypothetical protein
MAGSVVLAAGATSAQQLVGLPDEIARTNGAARLMATSTAAVVGSLVNCTWTVGNTVLTQDALISAAARFPIIPDDVISQTGLFAGERMFLTFRRADAAVGNETIRWAVDVEYAA